MCYFSIFLASLSTSLFLLQPSILKKRSMLSIGPGKLKSKPKRFMISRSSSIRACFETCLYSSLFNKLIILLNEGDVSYSSLADISVAIVARSTYLLSGRFQCPTIFKYRSKMCQAAKRVSILYPFRLFRSISFFIPQLRPDSNLWPLAILF